MNNIPDLLITMPVKVSVRDGRISNYTTMQSRKSSNKNNTVVNLVILFSIKLIMLISLVSFSFKGYSPSDSGGAFSWEVIVAVTFGGVAFLVLLSVGAYYTFKRA